MLPKIPGPSSTERGYKWQQNNKRKRIVIETTDSKITNAYVFLE